MAISYRSYGSGLVKLIVMTSNPTDSRTEAEPYRWKYTDNGTDYYFVSPGRTPVSGDAINLALDGYDNQCIPSTALASFIFNEVQSTTGTTTGFTAGAGTAVKDDSTFTGDSGSTAYTIGDIVLALKNIGVLTR